MLTVSAGFCTPNRIISNTILCLLPKELKVDAKIPDNNNHHRRSMEVTAFCTQTLPSEHIECRSFVSEKHQMFFFSFSKKGRKEKNSKLCVQLKAGVTCAGVKQRQFPLVRSQNQSVNLDVMIGDSWLFG